MNENGCYPFVNAIVTSLHCIYLMHSLHHTLLDCCKVTNNASYLWRIVRTRAAEEAALDIHVGSVEHGCGQAPCGNAPPRPPHPLVSPE
jgi:hypothetical protein